MGEIADMMIDGTLCQSCGAYIGPGLGFPRTCTPCIKGALKESKNKRLIPRTSPKQKVQCDICGKKVRGLSDHIRDAHLRGHDLTI
jgi:hypothetical protein